MPRYEFSEGSSNKFWDINLSGTQFTTTYGKIGAAGQTTIKSFKTPADAQKEFDKLVAEKVKKGYVLVGGKGGAKAAAKSLGRTGASGEAADRTDAKAAVKGGGKGGGKASKGAGGAAASAKAGGAAASAKAGAAASAKAGAASGVRDARNQELEAAIVANPSDREAYAVFADWLQEQGDPRGELMSLQLGYKDKQAKTLLDKHADYFLGPLAAHQTVYDSGANNSTSHLRSPAQEKEWEKTQQQAFLWRNGYIYRVRLSHDEYSHEDFDGKLVDILAQVLAHPSGRYIVEFAFQTNGDPNDDDLQDLIDLLGKKAPPTTRKITFGDNVDQISWHKTGNLGKLWKGVPNLRTLEIETGEFEVGKLDAPALERAIFITGGLSKSAGRGIATGAMPKIRHLEIYYGTQNYGGTCTIKDVTPLLARTDLTNLQYLGLKNSEFANDIAKALGGAPVLKTLKTLDLSLGTMTDAGAQALADAKASLAHLEVLDLRRNFLTKDGIKLVKGICPKVITDGQETADDYGDGEVHYYVSIAE